MFASFFDNLRIALMELRGNKTRSILTMLGIIIGIAAVVLLVSLGQGIQASITERFESLGASLIRSRAFPGGNGVFEPYSSKEVAALSNRVRAPAISHVLPSTSGNYPVVYRSTEENISVQGTTTDYLFVQNRAVEEGRFFTQEEVDNSGRVAVLGVTAAENLFGTVDPLGQSIRIQSVVFEVIGVLNYVGSGFNNDNLIIIPITTAQTRLDSSRASTGEFVIDEILVRAVDNDSVQEAVEQMERVLREERGIGAGEADDFRVFTATTILDSLTNTIQTFTIFLGILAGISLVVGGIGVMNIMLVTVNERTREIGVRKALGAQRIDIILQFLIEAIVITMFGGTIGVLLAFGGSALITALVDDFDVVVQVSSIILAGAISMSIGVFFGVYPASRAARLNPIDALRYE